MLKLYQSGKVKIRDISKLPVRRLTHEALTYMKPSFKMIYKTLRKPLSLFDNMLKINTRDGDSVQWFEQNFLFENITIHNQISASEDPNWRIGKPHKDPGVCIIDSPFIFILHPNSIRMQRYPNQRKAMVFTKRYLPVELPGSQRILSRTFLANLSRWIRKHSSVNHQSGRIAILGNFGFDTRNYYHFWADAMADLWYIRKLLPEGELPSHYLLPFCDLPWQWEVLEMCGINADQVIPLFEHDFLTTDSLVATVRDKGATTLPPWLAHAIREQASWKRKNNRNERRIYISRSDAPQRKVSNERQVCKWLSSAGFEVHTLNGLTVKEQQELFASAEIICSAHGAALTNLVWCNPGTIVIEFLPQSYLEPCFRDLAMQSGLLYHPIICQQENGREQPMEKDIIIENTQIETLLNIIAPSKRKII